MPDQAPARDSELPRAATRLPLPRSTVGPCHEPRFRGTARASSHTTMLAGNLSAGAPPSRQPGLNRERRPLVGAAGGRSNNPLAKCSAQQSPVGITTKIYRLMSGRVVRTDANLVPILYPSELISADL